MIFQNQQNNFDYKGVKQINESVIDGMYNAQSDKRGELFMLEDALLNKTISKEDQKLILEFYCETPITSSEEDLHYPKLKAQMWEAYKDFGKNSIVFKTTKREFESLDLKLTPVGRQYAIESIVEKKEVTFFEDLYSNAPKHTTIFQVLEDIKNEKYKTLIEEIRNSNSKDDKNNLKKKLPVVLFNGLFYKRHGDRFIKFSDYMCLDFDDFHSIEDVEKAKEKLIEDPYVYAVFKSPKGFGLKVLIKVKRKNTIEHLQLFEGAKAHFSIDGFDDACKDIARSCFMSSDPDLYINTKAEVFTKKLEVSAGNEKLSTYKQMKLKQNLIIHENDIEKKSSIFDETDLDKITRLVFKYWESKYSLNEGNRNNNLYKLSIKLYCSGVYESKIMDFFNLKFKNVLEDDDELFDIVASACKDETKFNSTPWVNYKFKNQIIELINSSSDEEINNMLELKGIDSKNIAVKSELAELRAKNQKFWFEIIDKNGDIINYNINHVGLVDFLKSQNIFCLNNGKAFSYYIIQDNIITETNIFEIKNLIISYIKNTQRNNEKLINSFLKQKSIFSDLFLSDLLVSEISTNRDTAHKVYKYFRNGVLIIEKEKKMRLIEYTELEFPVFKNQIIKKDFKLGNIEKSDFEIFIEDVSGKNLNSFKSGIGYLCSNFKNQSNAKAVILNDPTTSFTQAMGGKGKGLIGKAVSLFVNTTRIDGKKYKSEDPFNLAPVTIDSEVVFIDDLKQGFKFTDLFNVITDDMEVTKKYGDKFTIPFSISPKILLATNYPLVSVSDESSLRRSFHLILKDYYSTSKTPIDKFGKEFFSDDWNENLWISFYSYMADCVMFYIENGLTPMKFSSEMKLKKLIGNTSQDFLAFMNEKEMELKKTSFSLTNLKNDYYHYSNFNISARKLKEWLKNWCDFHDCKLSENRIDNRRVYKISQQVFYLNNFNKQDVA